MNHDHHKTEQLTRDQVVEDIVESFAERLTRGEKPSISEYINGHPEFERELRDVLSAMMLVDQVDRDLHQQAIPPEPVATQEDVVPSQLGDFHLLREAGRGGMGIVYEAEQLSLGRRVALKVLPTSVARDETFLKRFEREAKAAAKLHHTNIVPVFGVGQDHGQHFYAMQFIDGQSLDGVLQEVIDHFRDDQSPQQSEEPSDSRLNANRSLAQSLASGRFEATLLTHLEDKDDNFSADAQVETITARHSKTAPLVGNSALLNETRTEVVSRRVYFQSIGRIGQQVADALAYSHKQGILHRDIKPSNIILDHHGSAWVTDFGLAKVMDQHNLTQTGDILGTLRYMAPECFEARGDVRSDVYSLGMTLYELAGMQPAFDETDRNRLLRQVLHETPMKLSTIDPAIPADLVTIVHKAIDRDPNHRYQTAEEMADDLHRYLHDEPIKARRLSSLQKFMRVCRRNPLVASLTGLVATLLLVVAVGSTLAAVKFESLAAEKGELADELNSALGKAEGNLDLALEALDTVYLDAIGSEKLLSQPISRPDSAGNRDWVPQPKLSELEKTLLEKGLSFYDELARQNPATDRAFVQTALAYQRVGLMQAALGDHDSAAAAYQTAVERFEKLTQQNPDNADHFRKLGEAYRGLGSSLKDWGQAKKAFQNARGAYTQAIALKPDSAELYYHRGEILGLYGDDRELFNDFKRALELESDNPKYLRACSHQYQYGMYTAINDQQTALRLAQRAVELQPEEPKNHNRLADYYAWGKVLFNHTGPKTIVPRNRRKALEHYAVAIALAPDNPEYYVQRAKFLRELGEYQNALPDLQKALELAPLHLRALEQKAQIHAATGEVAKAIDRYCALLELKPHDSRSYLERGKLYAQQGLWKKAFEDFDTAIKIAPDYWYFKRRAFANFKLGRYADAVHDLRTGMRKNPKDVSFLYWIGRDLLVEAPEEFQKLMVGLADEFVEICPRPAAAYATRGRLHNWLGNDEEAVADFAKAIEINPRNSLAWEFGGDFQHSRGHYQKAEEMFTEGLKLDQKDPLLWLRHGLVTYQLGKYPQALESLSRALEIRPQSVRTLIRRAATLFHMGRLTEALADCRRAFEIDAEEAKSRLLDQVLQEDPFQIWSRMLDKND